ncbi:MAG: hypothetical protein OEU76_02925 [Cyclobacteriaceae bacterium]|nr:hypothetical protein [Cyclobacteriaceae bacterium]
MKILKNYSLIVALWIILISCTVTDETGPKVFDLDYMAHISPENFVNKVTNKFFPLSVGSTYTYVGESAGGIERIEIEILSDTRVVMGITCTIVRDKVYKNDVLIEDTFDWYAQDKDGNVWYFGEDVDNYIDGVVDNHYGSWEAGVGGAEPGIIMLANPVLNLKYRQEHHVGQAEDQGEVVEKNVALTVIAGSFTGCLKIKETNPLDPDFLEYKYFAPGIGNIKVEKIDTPVETEELESYDIK